MPTGVGERPEPGTAPTSTTPTGSADTKPSDVEPVPIDLNRSELLERAGVDQALLTDLERHGLVVGHQVGDEVFYDGHAQRIVAIAASMGEHGLEARHLKRYRVAASAEAGVLEQVVMPMLKTRHPESRAAAVATLAELSTLGRELAAQLLAVELERLTDSQSQGR